MEQPMETSRVYKAVKTDELERYTSDGWRLHGEPLRQQEVHEHEDHRGRPPTNEERNAGHYGTVYERPKAFFGDVLIFIVWKDKEQISREQQAESRAYIAEHKLEELTRAAKKHDEIVAKLTEERDLQQKRAMDNLNSMHARDDKNRKLEGDIAKIRTAIGTDRMNEILGIEKKS